LSRAWISAGSSSKGRDDLYEKRGEKKIALELASRVSKCQLQSDKEEFKVLVGSSG